MAIRFGQKIVTVKIELIKNTTKKEESASMYTILKEEMLEKVEPEFIDDEN